ncbi:hypothetical protein L596_000528 [Steinernema carpocapsae]|uniref:Uncharacterized protein n=1 Tax=Steinernema carpocapsae TaxID=34508 RepID=A0A4V6I6Y2_STECR|nr:hypothetical protein L596_000528 [Steinernema carpocapsae]
MDRRSPAPRSPATPTARWASPAPRQRTRLEITNERAPAKNPRVKHRLVVTSSDEDKAPRPKAKKMTNAAIWKKLEELRNNLTKQHEKNMKALNGLLAQLQE